MLLRVSTFDTIWVSLFDNPQVQILSFHPKELEGAKNVCLEQTLSDIFDEIVLGLH